MRTVFLTDISSYKSAVVARFLKTAYSDVFVVASDHRPSAARLRTKWIDGFVPLRAAPEDGAAYAEALGEAVRASGASHLFPVNSAELRHVVARRDLFGGALDYFGDADLCRRLDDKEEFARILEGAGAPRPKSYASLDAPPPLVVKPRRGSSSKGVVYLLTEADVARARSERGAALADVVIQEYFAGEGIGYSGFFRNGEILVGYAHRRVAEHPVAGGSSVVRERYPYDDRDALEAAVRRVLAAAPWSGPAMFELKRNAEGRFVFIECNPRIWGSVHQALADGANIFEPLLGPARSQPPRRGVRTELFPLSWLSLAGYLARGRLSVVADMMKGAGRTRLDVSPFSDFRGFVSLLRRAG